MLRPRVRLLPPELPDVLEPLVLPPDAPLFAAAVAALSIPPCPLQAPRPPWGEVEPSLQVTGVLVSATLGPGNASSAAHTNTAQAQETQSRILILYPLCY